MTRFYDVAIETVDSYIGIDLDLGDFTLCLGEVALDIKCQGSFVGTSSVSSWDECGQRQ